MNNNIRGKTFAEKMNLLELAQEYATPLYVYDGDLIRQKYYELLAYFPYPIKLFYAMKANFNKEILKLLLDTGASIDAVSPAEVLLALEIGFPKEKILFTANRTTEEEMKLVYDLGILCNVGSLSQLKKFGAAHPTSRVCIRLNPMVVAGENELVSTAGENSKFGIPLDKKREMLDIIKTYSLTVVGIHEHTGSGIPETVHMKQGVKNILAILDKESFPDLEFIDFGGGFKVSYRPNEKAVDYVSFGKEMGEIFSTFCTAHGKELDMYFEPGKFLVAEAGTLLVTVTDLVTTKNKILAGVNSGFPQLIRPMFYGAYHHIRNITHPNGEEETYDVVGNICESGDCFATDRNIPEIHEGDILSIETAGAYCYSMGGNYNLRPMPAEVLVLDEKVSLVTRRITHAELAGSVLDV